MMRRRHYVVLAAGLAFLFAMAPAQHAQAQVSFGPQVVLWDFDDVGIGARLDYGLSDAFGIDDGFFEGLFGSANANYVFAEGDGTMLVFNVNGSVPFEIDAAVAPYAGAGLNHWRWSFDAFGESFSTSSSGLNLLGGLFFDLGAVPAFAELQYSTTGAGFLTVSAGVLFGG